jgi:hypothetical protein
MFLEGGADRAMISNMATIKPDICSNKAPRLINGRNTRSASARRLTSTGGWSVMRNRSFDNSNDAVNTILAEKQANVQATSTQNLMVL